jgi:hypothetical protein
MHMQPAHMCCAYACMATIKRLCSHVYSHTLCAGRHAFGGCSRKRHVPPPREASITLFFRPSHCERRCPTGLVVDTYHPVCASRCAGACRGWHGHTPSRSGGRRWWVCGRSTCCTRSKTPFRRPSRVLLEYCRQCRHRWAGL